MARTACAMAAGSARERRCLSIPLLAPSQQCTPAVSSWVGFGLAVVLSRISTLLVVFRSVFCTHVVDVDSHCAFKLIARIYIVQSYNIILAEIAADLHLDELECDFARVAQPMRAADRHINRFILVHGAHFGID